MLQLHGSHPSCYESVSRDMIVLYGCWHLRYERTDSSCISTCSCSNMSLAESTMAVQRPFCCY